MCGRSTPWLSAPANFRRRAMPFQPTRRRFWPLRSGVAPSASIRQERFRGNRCDTAFTAGPLRWIRHLGGGDGLSLGHGAGVQQRPSRIYRVSPPSQGSDPHAAADALSVTTQRLARAAGTPCGPDRCEPRTARALRHRQVQPPPLLSAAAVPERAPACDGRSQRLPATVPSPMALHGTPRDFGIRGRPGA